jgi:cell division protein FtsN
MEQKQSLWIIAAVGVFLLVVIGAALILYSPAAKADSATVIAEVAPQQPDLPALPQKNGSEDAPVLQLQDLASLQQLSPPASGTSAAPVATLTAPDGSVITVPTQSPQYLALLQTLNVSPQATAIQSQAEPQTSTQRVNELTVISDRTNVIGTGATTFTGQQPASTEINIQTVTPIFGENAARPATAKAATPAKTATVTPKTPAPNQYWVQAASFSSKKNADTARTELEAQRIPCEIFTSSSSDGKIDYYRVRVGPYETKSDAEKAQAELRRIKNFESTQTFVVNSTKN